jgi:hypothetical protein
MIEAQERAAILLLQPGQSPITKYEGPWQDQPPKRKTHPPTLGAHDSTLDQAKRFTVDQLSDSEASAKHAPSPKAIRKDSPGKISFLNSVKEFLEETNTRVVKNTLPGVKDGVHNQYSHSVKEIAMEIRKNNLKNNAATISKGKGNANKMGFGEDGPVDI